jgi:hypothetical protein
MNAPAGSGAISGCAFLADQRPKFHRYPFFFAVCRRVDSGCTVIGYLDSGKE